MISEATAYRLSIPLAGEFEMSHGTSSAIPTFLVVLRTTDGKLGIGTADPVPSSAFHSSEDSIFSDLQHELLPELVSDPPVNPNECVNRIADTEVAKEAALATEMAFLDLYGKQTGQSIAAMLGGQLRQQEPLNGWVGIADPKTMAAEASEFATAGFTGLKIKISGHIDEDIDRIRAVWDAVGEKMQVRVDANAAYTVSEALELATAVEDVPLTHFEQPIDGADIEGLKQITEAIDIPVLADEAVRTKTGLVSVLRSHAADRVKLKIISLGSIFDVHSAIAAAELHGLSCIVGHGFCTLPAASAEVQVTTANRNVILPVETVGTLKIAEEPFQSQHSISNGTLDLVDAPGLGVSLLESELPKFVTESVTVD